MKKPIMDKKPAVVKKPAAKPAMPVKKPDMKTMSMRAKCK